MSGKIDINKLKSEIDSRKKEKLNVSERLGESNGSGRIPKNTFLNGLLKSLDSGRETSATQRLKLVENAVAVKNGEKARFNVSKTPIETPINVPSKNIQHHDVDDLSQERDYLMYENFNRKKSQTLSDSLANYSNNQQSVTNENYKKPQMINESYLNETVENIVNRKLSEGLESIVETAMKNVIFNIYSGEKMKETLHENSDLIKKIVYETIRELQDKKKKVQ